MAQTGASIPNPQHLKSRVRSRNKCEVRSGNVVIRSAVKDLLFCIPKAAQPSLMFYIGLLAHPTRGNSHKIKRAKLK